MAKSMFYEGNTLQKVCKQSITSTISYAFILFNKSNTVYTNKESPENIDCSTSLSL